MEESMDFFNDSVNKDDHKWCSCVSRRYTMAAQDLLMRSRGVLKERGWRLPNDKLGSGDDITVFVIPLAGQESETWGSRADWPLLLWGAIHART